MTILSAVASDIKGHDDRDKVCTCCGIECVAPPYQSVNAAVPELFSFFSDHLVDTASSCPKGDDMGARYLSKVARRQSG